MNMKERRDLSERTNGREKKKSTINGTRKTRNKNTYKGLEQERDCMKT